jgi:hypothetical protein
MAETTITGLIKNYLSQKDIKQAQLARMCNTTTSNMSQKLGQHDMELSWVIKISEQLDHNFLFDMANVIGVKYETKHKPVSIDDAIRAFIKDEIKQQTKPYAKNYNITHIEPTQLNEP